MPFVIPLQNTLQKVSGTSCTDLGLSHWCATQTPNLQRRLELLWAVCIPDCPQRRGAKSPEFRCRNPSHKSCNEVKIIRAVRTGRSAEIFLFSHEQFLCMPPSPPSSGVTMQRELEGNGRQTSLISGDLFNFFLHLRPYRYSKNLVLFFICLIPRVWKGLYQYIYICIFIYIYIYICPYSLGLKTSYSRSDTGMTVIQN